MNVTNVSDNLNNLNTNTNPYTIKMYKVGGCVRDEILGVKSKDIDYSVVIEYNNSKSNPINVEQGLELLEKYLVADGYTIFLKTPDTFTFRAKNNITGIIADFVLARHEIDYDPASRRPRVILGTLAQDLARRDFTINAMAKDEFGYEKR